MKFKIKLSTLMQALDTVSLVKPMNKQGDSGYLFVVQGNVCHIHSEDANHRARASCGDLLDVEGEGAFVFPADDIKAFKYLTEEYVGFQTKIDQGVHVLNWGPEGLEGAEINSLDPRGFSPVDKEFSSAEESHAFPVSLLREGLTLARPYLAEPGDNTKEYFQSIQVFDASKPDWEKANGTLYASDNKKFFAFYCEALVDKGLNIHRAHLGLVLSFLGRSTGLVRIRKGSTLTFLVNDKGDVVGWPNQVSEHGKYTSYALKLDDFVLTFEKEKLLQALSYVKSFMRHEMAILKYEPSPSPHLQCLMSDESTGKKMVKSKPCVVGPQVSEDQGGALSSQEGFQIKVNINSLIELVSMKSNQGELRVRRAKTNQFLLRTIETFVLDSKGKVVIGDVADASSITAESEGPYKCRVSRLITSMA